MSADGIVGSNMAKSQEVVLPAQSMSKLYATFFSFSFSVTPESYLGLFYVLIRPVTPCSIIELVSLPRYIV